MGSCEGGVCVFFSSFVHMYHIAPCIICKIPLSFDDSFVEEMFIMKLLLAMLCLLSSSSCHGLPYMDNPLHASFNWK